MRRGVEGAEVANECAVSARAEDEVSVLVTCGFAVEGEGWHVGGGWLDAVCHLDVGVALGECRLEGLAEGGFHANGDGVVDVALAASEAVGLSLGEMFLGGCAYDTVGVFMESNEAFGVRAVGEAVLREDEADGLGFRLGVEALELLGKGEVVETAEEGGHRLLRGLCALLFGRCGEELVQRLEHTAGGT